MVRLRRRRTKQAVARLDNAQREVLSLARDSTIERGKADLFLLGKSAGLQLARDIVSSN